MASNKYLDIVTAMTSKGFTKVCVVNKSYQVVGASAQDAVPSAWTRTVDEYDDKTGEVKGSKQVMVNENQELANVWADVKELCFFKTAFKIQFKADKKKMTDAAGKETEVCPMIAGLSIDKKSLLLAKALSDCWIIALAPKSGGLDLSAKGKKKGKKAAKAAGFSEVKVMIGKIGGYIDELDEDDE